MAPGISCEDDLIVLCFSVGRRDRKKIHNNKICTFPLLMQSRATTEFKHEVHDNN